MSLSDDVKMAMNHEHERIIVATALRHEYKNILEEIETVFKYHPVGPQDSAGYNMALDDFRKLIEWRSRGLDKIVQGFTTKTRKET